MKMTMMMTIMIITFMIMSVFLSSIKIAVIGMTVAVDFFQVAEDGQSKKKDKNGLLVDKGFFLSLLNIDSGLQLTNNKWETKYHKVNGNEIVKKN